MGYDDGQRLAQVRRWPWVRRVRTWNAWVLGDIPANKGVVGAVYVLKGPFAKVILLSVSIGLNRQVQGRPLDEQQRVSVRSERPRKG